MPRVRGRERFNGNSARIESLARKVSPKGAVVEINLVGVRRIAELNSRFRGRRGPSEILSFSYGSDAARGPEDPVGEIYICWARLARGAARRKVKEEDYMLRLVAHGLCHLEGYRHDDETGEREMEEVEKRLLRGFVTDSVISRLFE
jgi:probable rRNA maturation factor